MKNENENIHLTDGNVNISENVIANIAKIAAEEIDGVNKITKSVTATITDIFSKQPNMGVKVETNNNEVIIDLSVELVYGVNISEVASKVQLNVKSSIETMTGLMVKEVNVLVSGLFIKKNPLEENKA
ncbi:MAG: Asp23/Gls24 family envelope stress response protein [Firmicutes bacterium]|nr:Asp23/Gls24 family envelope stress response protein [Ezakiella sp.]MDD7761961.1 Asp23/Gls24 family envelope stress response protein [Bacillota bacterium]